MLAKISAAKGSTLGTQEALFFFVLLLTFEVFLVLSQLFCLLAQRVYNLAKRRDFLSQMHLVHDKENN